jgi:hypothetical protein
LKIEVGGYNPTIGKSYGEIGAEARTMHKSQGKADQEEEVPILSSFNT